MPQGPSYKQIGKIRNNFASMDIVNELVELTISKHYTNKDLLKHLKDKYGYSKSMCYLYLNAATDEIVEIQKRNADKLLETQQLKLLTEIKKMTERDWDKSVILSYIKEFHKISGLYIEKLDVSGDITIRAQFDTPETEDETPDTDLDNTDFDETDFDFNE